jgi:NAD(P)-dependent dehydrogenase (short-subunit alcohol dehydrogenase family)
MAPPPNLSHLGLSFTSKTHQDTYSDIDPTISPPPHDGKNILVTGSARGMGQATVISYAKSGVRRIAIADREDGEETRSLALQAAKDAGRQGLEVLVFKVDVCDYSTIEACATELSSKWGHLDILVNFAGYLSPFQPLGDTDKEDWWKTWEVNVRGVYWVVRALLPLLLKSSDKTIVNVTSVGALALTPGASAYQPSKLAVLRLADYLMLDYADQVSPPL